MDLREGFCELSWNLSEGKRGRKTSGKGMRAKLLQSYLTLCNPMDCSPPRSSVHRIFQARVLEWVAIAFSKYLNLVGISQYQVFFLVIRIKQTSI